MAAFASTSVPMWLTGMTYDGDGGNDLRNSMITALTYPLGPAAGSSAGVLSGVLGARGLAVSAASGMTVNVQGGSFLAAATVAANGGYTATLASQATLTVAASDSVNPRIDLVCATVTDNGNSTSSGVVQVITGTPASSPSAPSLPATSIPLAHVAVAALSTSVVSGNITDLRTYTCASGGILHAPIASPPAGIQGQYAYDAASDALYHNANAGPRQTRTLPFAPQMVGLIELTVGGPGTGALTLTGTGIGISTNGVTDIKVTYHIPGIKMPSPVTAQVKFCITLDGTQIDETDQFTYSTDEANISGHGFTGVYCTSSLTGDTPSAGYHTVQLTGYSATNNETDVVSNSGRTAYLRVEPVGL